MNLFNLAPSYIRALAPYQPGKPIAELAREMDLDEKSIIKLASNENPLGMSPKAKLAIEQAVADLARYPDGNGFNLKKSLAKRLAVSTENIVIGNGSNDILELVAQVFLTPQSSSVYSQYAFAVYPLATQARGARGVVAKAKNFAHNLDEIAQAISSDTKIVFIANPNNPTGTLLSSEEIKHFLERVPQNIIVVLDEAYNEYLPSELKVDSIAWLKQHSNLVVTRTFSKAYGLAGLRVGYGIAHVQVIDLMNRVRQPFNVNSLAQAAAVAALEDENFVAKSYELNRAGMKQLAEGCKQLGLFTIPSYGNFISINFGSHASEVYRYLLKRGVIVRPLANYDMPEYLRVSIGLIHENQRFLDTLKLALKELTVGNSVK